MGYMHETKAREGLYLAKNKNTDELYAEFIDYDPVYCSELISKAKRIIESHEPQRRIGNSPDFFKCKICDAAAVCHQQKTPPRSCRNCARATPAHGTTWVCSWASGAAMEPKEQASMVKCGGREHRFLPGLVPGNVIEETSEAVKYQLANGEWTDNGNSEFS